MNASRNWSARRSQRRGESEFWPIVRFWLFLGILMALPALTVWWSEHYSNTKVETIRR